MNKDTKYRHPIENIEDFVFDESVSHVFENMVDRSVPGYRTLIANIGLIATQFVTPNSNCYDLGCSHGAGAFSIYKSLNTKDVCIYAIDNAAAMLKHCEQIITKENADSTIKLQLKDIQDAHIENASFVLLNLTLQFIPIEARSKIIQKIFEGLNPNGACVITEKIIIEDAATENLFQSLHHNFKAANQYSELEISQKRKALENVLIRETIDDHTQRLLNAGFSKVTPWFQCFNFVSMLAIK